MLKFSKAEQDRSLSEYNVDRNYNSKLEYISIDLIRPNPYQPRKIFTEDSLDELTQSLLSYGQLSPITVRRTGYSHYELIAGERRWRAAKRAGFTHIKAIVQNAVEQDSAMIALIENLQRENLHFFEEAEAFLNLIRDHGFTQEELAMRLGKNQSTIANKLRILKLPRKVKENIIMGKLTERHARSLLRLHNEEMQLKLILQIRENNLSVKITEELVESALKRLYGEVPESQQDPVQNVLFLIRDPKLSVNAIKKTCDKLKSSGIELNYAAFEQQEKITLKIDIFKSKY